MDNIDFFGNFEDETENLLEGDLNEDKDLLQDQLASA